MPDLGEVSAAKAIGKTGGSYVWAICPTCQGKRWVQITMWKPASKWERPCRSCTLKGGTGIAHLSKNWKTFS